MVRVRVDQQIREVNWGQISQGLEVKVRTKSFKQGSEDLV